MEYVGITCATALIRTSFPQSLPPTGSALTLSFRPCSVIPEMNKNGTDWEELNPPQACDGIIPLQSPSIRVGLGITEQAFKH
jgi:hypothetical protein